MASAVFSKLNWKGQPEILVLHAPESFEAEIAALEGVCVLRDLRKTKAVPFALAFVTKQAEVDKLANALCPRAEGDAILWFAYPKGTSKRYQCDFNRDTGWAKLGEAGFEPVRQVAIDEDWSALRFRRIDFIRNFKRDATRALSEKGRQRGRVE